MCSREVATGLGGFMIAARDGRHRLARRVVAVLSLLPLGGVVRGQPRSVYVSDVSGSWEAIVSSGSIALAPLLRVPAEAKLRYAGDPADASSAFLDLRDARTLGKARLRCGAGTDCTRPASLAQLQFLRSATSAGGASALYAIVGEQPGLRQRLRLVGARGDDRALAVIVLATDDRGGVDVQPLASALSGTGAGLVARFCALTGAEDEECLASRRPMPADCAMESGACRAPRTPGAYRVDVYAREKSLLSTLAVASGFAVLVDRQGRAAASSERDALVAPLLQARDAFGNEEWRGLLAAATVKIAGAAR